MTSKYQGQEDDEKILNEVGLTLKQIDEQAHQLEDETMSDNLGDYYYPHFHQDTRVEDDPMRSFTVRVRESELRQISQTAKKFNLTRSEYVRRKLAA